MKPLFVSLLLSFLNIVVYSQDVVKARTASGFVNISKDPPKPAFIEMVSGSVSFADPDKNSMLNANEQATILFQIKNSGAGDGLNLNLRCSEKNGVPGITIPSSTPLGNLLPGATLKVEVPISAGMNTTNGVASISIQVDESNGFGTDPFFIEVPVKAFIPPQIKIIDYIISSQSGTTIEKKKPFEVQILVQNVGQGKAENISLSLPVQENIFCLTNNSSLTIPALGPGEQKLIEYTFIANNNYMLSDIRLAFQLKEKYGKYAENRSLNIAMNQQVASEKLVVQGTMVDEKPIVVGSLTSAVDKNIPGSAVKRLNRYALIIGNENYTGSLNAEINVDYAVNDAGVFRQYVIQTLGVPEANVYYLTNATAGEMRLKIELVSKLMEKIGSQAELIFYYAGHGFPEESTRIPYLIPVDVNATNLSAAIKLSEVYDLFGNSGAGRVTIFLDACFSGGGRSQGLLAARGVKIKPTEESVIGNMVVFSASSGEQSALPLHREKHGLFTYYLLKKLQETGGNISYSDLERYLYTTISIESLRESGKEQDPVVNVSPAVMDVWKTWKLNH